MHLGNNYSGSSFGAYVDMAELVELLEQEPIEATDNDKRAFSQLLQSLDRAEAGETPGQYEKRLTGEKIMKGHAGIRRGMLQALARVGVLPNRILELSPDRWTDMATIIHAEFELTTPRAVPTWRCLGQAGKAAWASIGTKPARFSAIGFECRYRRFPIKRCRNLPF